jgi:hypothetical protein
MFSSFLRKSVFFPRKSASSVVKFSSRRALRAQSADMFSSCRVLRGLFAALRGYFAALRGYFAALLAQSADLRRKLGNLRGQSGNLRKESGNLR